LPRAAARPAGSASHLSALATGCGYFLVLKPRRLSARATQAALALVPG
jgi:hypothetical protein